MGDRDPYDVVIIGGGSAGLVGGQIAAALGARVALVEQSEQPGGECLWTGCVPSKALIAAAQRAVDVRAASSLGINASLEGIHWEAVLAHVQGAQAAIAPHDSRARLGKLGIRTFHGKATVHSSRSLTVSLNGGSEITLATRNVVLATGSAPIMPPIPGLASARAVTTDTIWSITGSPPERLVVIGGGVAGCELGQAYARLGTHVTLIESGARVLAGEEPWVSELIAQSLAADGVELRTGVQASRVDSAGVWLDDGSVVEHDLILVATGRKPRTDCLQLDGESVRLTERGQVHVDRMQRTNVRGIWAAGDVTGQLELTNAAGIQGANAVLNALLRTRLRFDAGSVPRAVFTDPQVARVGLTEQQARSRHDQVEIVSMPMTSVDRAVATGRTAGELRLVTLRGSRLLGATIVGFDASEQITQLASLLDDRGAMRKLVRARHAYPTMNEVTQRAALDHRLGALRVGRSGRAVRMLVRLLARRR